MPAKFFRCHNEKCMEGGKHQDFYADKPVCPKCNTDGDAPRCGHVVVRLNITHFDAPSGVPGVGVGYRACNPSVSVAVPMRGKTPFLGHVATGNPMSVTCPECKASETFRQVMARMDEDDIEA